MQHLSDNTRVRQLIFVPDKHFIWELDMGENLPRYPIFGVTSVTKLEKKVLLIYFKGT